MESHDLRITDHGKIKTFVTFGLKYLKEHPECPLTLHTLPHQQTIPSKSTEAAEPPKKKRKLASPISTIPRLISVAEIIKREFASLVYNNEAGEGNSSDTVLHQYNILGTLEDLEASSSPMKEPEQPSGRLGTPELLFALEGKNHPKRALTPYMKITLCSRKLPELEKAGATYQLVPPKKPTKSAKARLRKRAKKANEGKVNVDQQEAETSASEQEPTMDES